MKKLYALLVATVLTVGCATVRTNPTVDETAKTQSEAAKIFVATEAGVKIIDQIGLFLNNLPTQEAKNDFNCAVVKVTGTTAPRPELLKTCGPDTPQGPGPLKKAMDELKLLTTMPSLRTTTTTIIRAVDPLLKKLESSSDNALKALGMSLRATLGIVFAFGGQ